MQSIGLHAGGATSRSEHAANGGRLLHCDRSRVWDRERGPQGWYQRRVAMCNSRKHRDEHVADMCKAAIAEHRRAVRKLADSMGEILRLLVHEI